MIQGKVVPQKGNIKKVIMGENIGTFVKEAK